MFTNLLKDEAVTHLLLNINWRMFFNAFRWIWEELLQFTISFWASSRYSSLRDDFVIDFSHRRQLYSIWLKWFDLTRFKSHFGLVMVSQDYAISFLDVFDLKILVDVHSENRNLTVVKLLHNCNWLCNLITAM